MLALDPPPHSPTLRELPSIEKLISAPELSLWKTKLVHKVRVRLARNLVSEVRKEIGRGSRCPSFSKLVERLAEEYNRLDQSGIKKVINATGVVLHTGLGRAPLGRATLEMMAETLENYCTLEFDSKTGERGERTAAVEQLLTVLCPCPAALVVNNNAAAVFLVLQELAREREVILSRGELVQIGGGFRVPEILKSSGAILVEVGTTNITRPADYAAAISPRTAMLLKVHQSCFQQTGHTEAASLTELSLLAKQHHLICVADVGSGQLGEGSHAEITIERSLEAGADLVCFSGDKLLGGPQAGILVGDKILIERLKKSPLYRALRLGKLEIFALEQTLLGYARGTANPTQMSLSHSACEIEIRSHALAKRLTRIFPGVHITEGVSVAGGGSSPAVELPTFLIEFSPSEPERFSKHLLGHRPKVVLRRENGKLAIDLRTVLPSEEPCLLAALEEAAQCTF